MVEDSDDALWRAVREEVVTYGVSRSTVTSVARRAGLSRMTVYRRAGGMEQLVLDALAHELGTAAVIDPDLLRTSEDPVGDFADAVTAVVTMLMDSTLIGALRRHDPELLMPYLVGHFGRGQASLSEQLTARLGELRQRCQELSIPLRQSVTEADQARVLMIALQSFVMAAAGDDEQISRNMLATEMRHLVAGYLKENSQ